MRRTLVVSVVIGTALIGAVLLFLVCQRSQETQEVVRIGTALVHVEVADSDSARVQGLSGRDALSADSGMLFVFDHDDKYSFWMKDMRFSIDILWLSADGTIVYAAPNVDPSTYPQSFTSSTTARYVLELPARYMQSHGIQIGDAVMLP